MEKNIKVALMDNGLLVTLVLVQYILDVACIGILMNLQKKDLLYMKEMEKLEKLV